MCRREDLCRVCGCRLQKALKAKGKTGKREPQYACRSYSKDLMTAFDIDVVSDAVEIHSQMFCILCHKAMTRIVRAKECQTPYKFSVQPYNWHTHTLDTCKVCKPFHTLRWQGTFKPGWTKGYTPKALITLIEALAPPPVVASHPYPALAHVQVISTSVMNMLMCPICIAVLQQPIQLPCHMCVCV